jgi:hypothetical protein
MENFDFTKKRILNMNNISGRRIIDRLRRMYPNLIWTYSYKNHCWENSAGWSVRPKSMLSPKFDGDDDSFETVYYRSDTNEIVPIR